MQGIKAWKLGIGVPALFCLMGLQSCPDPGDDDDTDIPGLTWYYTCGDPVCSGYTPPEDVPPCTDEQAGDSCSTEGTTCDPKDDCNRLLVCASEDPTQQEGGCPISRRSAKDDIVYLRPAELERLHEDVLQTRLATWHYKGTPASSAQRLGFIIDDQPSSPAVLPNGNQVDVYGYTSMAVAAIQVQDKEIQSLRHELDALKRDLDAVKSQKCGEAGK